MGSNTRIAEDSWEIDGQTSKTHTHLNKTKEGTKKEMLFEFLNESTVNQRKL